MQAILTIILNDLRIFFSRRGNLIGLLVIPVLLTLVLGLSFGGFGGGPTRLRVDLIDLDQSDMSARLSDELHAANDALALCPLDNDADDYCQLEEAPLDLERAIERARQGTTRALIVIPAGYATALETFQRANIDYYSTSDAMIPGPVLQTLKVVLQRVNSASLTTGVAAALLDNLTGALALPALSETARADSMRALYLRAQQKLTEQPVPIGFTETHPAAIASYAASANGFNQSAPGMGSMYVMFTVLGGMAALLRERRQWTLQRLIALPLSRAQILGSKIGAFFVRGMIQYLIIFAVGAAAGMNFGGNPLALLTVMVAFVLCITALTFALAPRITSESQANGIVLLLSLSLAPLGGAWWPLEIVPEFMQTIGHLSPVAWAMDGFQDLIYFGGGFSDVLPDVGVLLGAAVVLFVVGIRSFKYE
jgi:ABC-2 type transport system permease protein